MSLILSSLPKEKLRYDDFMAKKNKRTDKILIVEGEQDKRVIPELIEAKGINWEPVKDTPIVYIKACGGNKNINSKIIENELKEPKLTNLGFILDADDNPLGCWESIRKACHETKKMVNLPQKLPKSGLIHQTNTDIKFGVWIMPDNQQQGMLETFLSYMIDDENESTWQYSQEVVKESKNKGATFKDSHLDKANIYTYLAWQNEPGRQLHQAIKERILNPKHPEADIFFNWFRDLYDL